MEKCRLSLLPVLVVEFYIGLYLREISNLFMTPPLLLMGRYKTFYITMQTNILSDRFLLALYFGLLLFLVQYY